MIKAIDQLFGQLCNFIVALEDNSVIYTNIKQVVKFMFSAVNDKKKTEEHISFHSSGLISSQFCCFSVWKVLSCS